MFKKFWQKFVQAIKDAFVWVPPEDETVITPTVPAEPSSETPVVDPVTPVTDGASSSDMDTPAEIVKAIWAEELKDLTPQELDELAALYYRDDPEVEIVDISAGDPEAGEHHGVNTEEEMLGTYDPNQEYVDEPWEE